MKNRCFVDIAMKFIHKDLYGKLNMKHVELLAGTPFFHLLGFPIGTHCNNGILHQMLLLWSPEDGAFKCKKKLLHFTREDVSMIMCLPSTGTTVKWKRATSVDSALRCKHFASNTSISRQELESAILKAIDKNCKAEEVVGLLVVYLFTTILFPQTGTTVPVHMFHYGECTTDLAGYNWGDAVYDLLMYHIPTCAAWCKLVKLREEAGGISSSSESEDSSDEDDVRNKKKKKKNEQKKRKKSKVENQEKIKKGKKKVEEEDVDEDGKPSQYFPGCTLALIVRFFPSQSCFHLLLFFIQFTEFF